MSRYLFRGKRLSNGGWVYGGYWQTKNGIIYIIQADTKDGGKFCSVDPATVGQFTGLLDKNGDKIFEGDIVRFWETSWDDKTNAVRYVPTDSYGSVIFEDDSFHIKANDDSNDDFYYADGTKRFAWDRNIELTGKTVHDQPDKEE